MAPYIIRFIDDKKNAIINIGVGSLNSWAKF